MVRTIPKNVKKAHNKRRVPIAVEADGVQEAEVSVIEQPAQQPVEDGNSYGGYIISTVVIVLILVIIGSYVVYH